MRKTFIIIGAVLVAAFALLLMLAVGQRRTDWPKVSVTLLGYTNDATGSRLARFAVTNLSQSAVIRGLLDPVPKCKSAERKQYLMESVPAWEDSAATGRGGDAMGCCSY